MDKSLCNGEYSPSLSNNFLNFSFKAIKQCLELSPFLKPVCYPAKIFAKNEEICSYIIFSKTFDKFGSTSLVVGSNLSECFCISCNEVVGNKTSMFSYFTLIFFNARMILVLLYCFKIRFPVLDISLSKFSGTLGFRFGSRGLKYLSKIKDL